MTLQSVAGLLHGVAGEQVAATMSDTFAVFTRKLLRVSKRYPSAATFIPSMHTRMMEVLPFACGEGL